MRLCEAAAMDAATLLLDDGTFKADVEPIVPCDEVGTVEVSGFVLCGGCAEAMDLFLSLGGA